MMRFVDTEYERLLMREPDAEDLERCPEALRVIEAEDLEIVWPLPRKEIERLRDLCNEALGL